MHKQLTKHFWKIWGRISLGLVLLLVALGAIGSVYGLRSNNQEMVRLREVVFEADRNGNTEEIDTAVKALASHVTSHMNTDISKGSELTIEGEQPLQLVNKYYRDSHRDISRVAGTSQANLALIGEARKSCEVAAVPATERLSCLRQKLADLSSDKFPVVEPLSKDFYVFNFASPTWSPDLAGFSLVLFGLSIVLLLVRFVVGAGVSAILRSRTAIQ